MPYSNGRITRPVSIADIQRAVGSGSNDLGTLCVYRYINKYATFKPLPSGGYESIARNGTAPYGLRTIYARVNPSTGEVSPSNNTTLQQAIETLNNAIIGGYSNPFLADLTMHIKPSGGISSAYRQTDFVTTQKVRATGQVMGQETIHGYKPSAKLRYGYHDVNGVYHGLYGRSLSVDSSGNIVCDGNQTIDQTIADIWGSTFVGLETRLGWNARWIEEENDLCVLDWLDAMWSCANTSLHRAVVLFTGDWTEHTGFVAVGVLPWGAGVNTWASAIAGDPTRSWNYVEFLTNAPVTSSDFTPLANWSNVYSWMLIPGLIGRGLHVASNDPYLIGATFSFCDTNQFAPYGLNLYVNIRNMGLNTQLTVFLSTTANPGSIYDYALNSATGFVVTATGSYNIYGTNTPQICPSDVTYGSYRRFNQVFTVGQVYYVCIWGQANQSSSSARVIWSQAVIATSADTLEIYQ